MKYIFEVRGTDCINYSNGQKGAGDNIRYVDRKSLKAAINAGEKMLKDPEVYSVWIEKYATGDMLGQWVNYKDWTEGWLRNAI